MAESAKGKKRVGRCCLWPDAWRRFKGHGTSSLFNLPGHVIRVEQSLGNQELSWKDLGSRGRVGGSASYDTVNNMPGVHSRMFSLNCGE